MLVHPLTSVYFGIFTFFFLYHLKDSQKVITNLKERLKELEEQLQEREVSIPVILLINSMFWWATHQILHNLDCNV